MLRLCVSGLLLLLAYLLFWPVSIDPVAWQPPMRDEDDARFAVNQRLAAVERIAEGVGIGPEAVNVNPQGQLVTGFIDGRIMRFSAEGSDGVLLADTQGRPLGLDYASNGELIVADAVHGLIGVGENGKWRVIANEAGGVAVGFADDVDVSSDDVAYFSDASVRYGVDQVRDDIFEHRPHGRVLATELDSGRTQVLVDGLYFANGIALGPDERYLLITETARYRVLRHWLKGARAGETEVFIDNLPGFPDNITFNGRDRFWLAVYAPRTAALDALLPRPFLRKVVWRLPRWVQPDPRAHGMAFGLDLDGNIVTNLQDPGETAFAPVTSVRESNGYLYFGSLSAPSLARLPWREK